MNREKIICPCKKVTKGDVLDAIEKGAHKFKQVKECTGAGSQCGHCKDDIKKLIRKQLKDHQQEPCDSCL